MFKKLRKAVKKFMSNQAEVVKIKAELLRDIMNLSDNGKIGVGIGVLGSGLSIGLGFIVTSILNKKGMI